MRSVYGSGLNNNEHFPSGDDSYENVHTLTTTSIKKHSCLQKFLEILKCKLKKFLKILKKCFHSIIICIVLYTPIITNIN